MRLAPTLAMLLLAAVANASAPVTLDAGIPVTDALELLRERGLRVIYSSVLVPRTLTLEESVTGLDPPALARAILERHGLGLRALGSNVFAVVEARAALRWTLSGRILNSWDGRPVERARVEIVDSSYVDWTDRQGAFALRLTGRDERTLTVLADGFASESRRVQYPGPQPSPLAIRLDPAPAALAEVTIVSSRFTYDDPATVGTFTLTQADIVAQPKFAEDALQAIARLPGIALSGVSARPNVRGGEANEMLVVLDGMPIREAFHLPGYNSAFSAIDESLVARLDAYTGPLPARFGNRLSGVLALESAPVDHPGSSSVGLSTFNARLRTGRRHEGPGPGEWLASGRIGTARLWLEDYSPDVGLPSYGDVFFKAGLHDGRGTEWRAGALGSGSRFAYFDADTTENARLDAQSAYVWLAASRDLGAVRLDGLLGFSDIQSERKGALTGGLTPEGELVEERSGRIWDATLTASLRVSDRQSLQAGVAASLGQANYRHASHVEFDPIAGELFGAPELRERDIRLDARRRFASAFASHRWQWAPHAYLESGLRFDRSLESTEPGRGRASPRIAARWDPDAATTLRLSWGRAHQFAEAHELRVEDGEAAFAPPQRADQWVLSAERRLHGGVSLRVEGFDRWIPNPRVRYENLLDPLRLIPDLSPDRIAVHASTSRMRGLETSAQLERGEWSLWGAYTWSKAEDRIEARWTPRDWDQRHTLTAGAAWRRGPWSASAFAAHHSGRPETPVIDVSLESPQLGARNSARLASYFTVDARVARELATRRGRLTVFAQITNLLNRANRCCTEIDLPDEDSDLLVLERESIQTYPILPALGVQWDF